MFFTRIPSVSYPYSSKDILKIFAGLFTCKEDTFIQLFKILSGHQYNFDVTNGRSALFLILNAIKGLKPERNEVLVSALTCESVGNTVKKAGLTPVYYDVNQNTFGSDVSSVQEKISSDTLAVISSSLFGIPSFPEELSELCRSKDIFMIEDNAHVAGVRYKGKVCGHFGDACFYSFGPSKSISMISGGMASTNNLIIAECIDNQYRNMHKGSFLSALKNYAGLLMFYCLTKPVFFYFVTRFRTKFSGSHKSSSPIKMNCFHYSAGITALSNFEIVNSIRRENTKILAEIFESEDNDKVKLISGETCIRFPVICSDSAERDKLIGLFRKNGIWATQSIFHVRGSDETQYPIAKKISEKLMLLPSSARLKERNLNRIKEVLYVWTNKKI